MVPQPHVDFGWSNQHLKQIAEPLTGAGEARRGRVGRRGQVLAIALDCTTRAARHHRNVAAQLEGETAAFFDALGTSETQRATMLRTALRAQLKKAPVDRSFARTLLDTLESVRHAAKRYETLALRANCGRTRTFLLGMVDVCVLHAAEIERNAGDLLREVSRPYPDDEVAELPTSEPAKPAIDLASAMHMACAAQKRAALVHEMLAHAYRDDEAAFLSKIAEAERKHASTIMSVLDRLFPHVTLTPLDDPASPVVEAPRHSRTCPAGTFPVLRSSHGWRRISAAAAPRA